MYVYLLLIGGIDVGSQYGNPGKWREHPLEDCNSCGDPLGAPKTARKSNASKGGKFVKGALNRSHKWCRVAVSIAPPTPPPPFPMVWSPKPKP